MEPVAAGGGKSNAAKKQRRGKTSKTSGSSATTPSSSRVGKNYPAASAKDLVEATGRYLSEYLRHQRVHALAPGERCGEISTLSGCSAQSAVCDLSSSTRQLCAQFFPALLPDGGDDCAEESRQKQRPPPFPTSPEQNMPATSTSTSSSTTKDMNNDSAKQNKRWRKGKGKGSSKNKRNSRSGGKGGSQGQELSERGEDVRAYEDHDGLKKAFVTGGAGDGVAFLNQFRKARLHYEVRKG